MIKKINRLTAVIILFILLNEVVYYTDIWDIWASIVPSILSTFQQHGAHCSAWDWARSKSLLCS